MTAPNIGALAPDYLTTTEVARLAGTTACTVTRWIKDGRLPAYRFGRRYKVERSDADDFLAAAYTASNRWGSNR